MGRFASDSRNSARSPRTSANYDLQCHHRRCLLSRNFKADLTVDIRRTAAVQVSRVASEWGRQRTIRLQEWPGRKQTDAPVVARPLRASKLTISGKVFQGLEWAENRKSAFGMGQADLNGQQSSPEFVGACSAVVDCMAHVYQEAGALSLNAIGPITWSSCR
jgi:hypothetical protein